MTTLLSLVARRGRTADRGPPDDPPGPPLSGEAAGPLVVGELGPKRKLLPNGSLLCEDVPIARTGWMQYRIGEVPVDAPTRPGASPVLFVNRGPEVLFSPETMSSFVGSAITHEHPPLLVSPENWATLAKGTCLRVWRGEGDEADCLMADLLITDKWLIEQINANKREVSCGYDAEYKQTGDGEGAQVRIIGNHIALVERGRCGPRCAIGDSDSTSSLITQERPMAGKTAAAGKPRIKLLDDIMGRVRTQMAEEIGEEEEAGGDGAVHVHVHTGATNDRSTAGEGGDGGEGGATTMDAEVDDRFKKIEAAQAAQGNTLKEILDAVKKPAAAAGATTDAAPQEPAAEGDSKALERSYQELASHAEILMPGFRTATFDGALPRARTVDSMCAQRRTVLSSLANTTDGKALIDQVAGADGIDLAKADCSAVALVFRAAASLKGAANTRQATGDASRVPANQQPQKPQSLAAQIAGINETNAAFWSGKR